MTEHGKVSWIVQLIFWVMGISILVLMIMWPDFVPYDRIPAKEAECKSNLHAIQIVLERYYTDHGEYPTYLLGGDIEGWEMWHEQWDGYGEAEMHDGRIASNDILSDPLVDLGYIGQYPMNAWYDSDPNEDIRAAFSPGSYEDLKLGDPRFGSKGRYIGMCLDDPDWFCGAMQPNPSGWSEIETRRTLDHGDWMQVRDEFRNPGISGYYLFGGRGVPESGEYTSSYWPGNFFYRALSDSEVAAPVEGRRFGPSSGVYESYQHFILGAYGAERTEGMDVIRLEPFNPDGELLTWCFPEDLSEEIIYCGYGYPRDDGTSGGLPEVFGGGDAWNGPMYPYVNPDTGNLIYGAPDGIPDGVLLVVTDGASQTTF